MTNAQEEAPKLLQQTADGGGEEPRTGPQRFSESLNADANTDLRAPSFLHERELSDAVRVVNLIASGRNPFSDEPFEKLRPDHRDAVTRALCIVVSAIAQAERIAIPVPKPKRPPEPATEADPWSKRPLEAYLQRLEREAIVEALEETHYNRSAAARLLGITFRALRYRLESLGLEDSHDVEPPAQPAAREARVSLFASTVARRWLGTLGMAGKA